MSSTRLEGVAEMVGRQMTGLARKRSSTGGGAARQLAGLAGGLAVTLLVAMVPAGVAQALTITPGDSTVNAGGRLGFTLTDVSGKVDWLATYGTITPAEDGLSALYTAPFEAGVGDVAVADANGISVVEVTVREVPKIPSVLSIPGGRLRLVAGDVHPMSVSARFSDGRSEDYTGKVVWSSEDETVARVEPDGVVVALAAGEGAIVATGDGLRARVVLVVEPRIGKLVTKPNPLLISETGQGRLTISRRLSRGELDTVNNASCQFTVEPETIARVGDDGTIIAIKQGQGSVQVSCGENSATVPLFVNPVGALAVTPSRFVVEAGSESGLLLPSGGAPPYLAVSEAGEVKADGAGFRINAPDKAGQYRVWINDDLGDRSQVMMEVVAALRVTPAILDLQRGQESALAVVGGVEPLQWVALRGTVTPLQEGGAIYRAPGVSGIDEITVFDARGQRQQVLVNIESGLVTSPQMMVLEPSAARSFHITGGTPPYTIVASAGAYGREGDRFNYRAPDVAGQYAITVNDDIGRVETISINVRNPLQLSPHELFLEPGEETTIEVSGGFGDLAVRAISGEISHDGGEIAYVAPQVKGLDVVTVTDQEGTIAQMTVSVNSDGIFISPARSYLLPGEDTGLRALGGTPPYQWSIEGVGDLSASEGEQVVFTAATTTGKPLVTVTDANGNQTVAEVVVSNGKLKVTPELVVAGPGERVPLKALFGVPEYQWSVRRGELTALSGETVEYLPPAVPLGEDLITVEESTGQVATVRVVFVRDEDGDVMAIYGDANGRVGRESLQQALGDFFGGSGWLSRGDLYRLLENFKP